MNAGRESSCVINPEGNSLLQKWDVFIFLALIYTSVVTPFEVLRKIIFCLSFLFVLSSSGVSGLGSNLYASSVGAQCSPYSYVFSNLANYSDCRNFADPLGNAGSGILGI